MDQIYYASVMKNTTEHKRLITTASQAVRFEFSGLNPGGSLVKSLVERERYLLNQDITGEIDPFLVTQEDERVFVLMTLFGPESQIEDASKLEAFASYDEFVDGDFHRKTIRFFLDWDKEDQRSDALRLFEIWMVEKKSISEVIDEYESIFE